MRRRGYAPCAELTTFATAREPDAQPPSGTVVAEAQLPPSRQAPRKKYSTCFAIGVADVDEKRQFCVAAVNAGSVVHASYVPPTAAPSLVLAPHAASNDAEA